MPNENALAVSLFMSMLGLALLLCCVLLTALHELGHALAALALQPGRVTLYLGSHGQAAGGGRVQLGRLRLYFRYNPVKLALGGGLCRAQYLLQAHGQTWRALVYVLAGPLLPLAAGTTVLCLAFTESLHLFNVVKALAVLFFGATLLSALVNLRPQRRAIKLASGRTTYNDGAVTQLLLQRGRLLQEAHAADACYAAGDYAQGAQLDELLLGRLGPREELFRRLVQAHLLLHSYAPALTVSRRFQQVLAAEFNDSDLFMQALLLSRLDQHAQAQVLYTALIERETPHPNAYNNRGYTHNLLGEYELAIADFEQALATDGNAAYTYNNRGLARLKLGQEAAGLADIAHGMQLDPENAYGYRNLGIYHLDQGEYAAALALFEQAQQLDPHTHLLADYINQARQHLEMDSGAGGYITS